MSVKFGKLEARKLLNSAVAPFVLSHVGDNVVSQLVESGPPGATAMIIAGGENFRNLEKTHEFFPRTFRFPAYYGENWSALTDCMTDDGIILADKIVMTIMQAERVLPNSDREFGIFSAVLSNIGERWSLPPPEKWRTRRLLPFHCVFVFSEKCTRSKAMPEIV